MPMPLHQRNNMHSIMYFPENENSEIKIHAQPSCYQHNFLIGMSYEVKQYRLSMILILAVVKLDSRRGICHIFFTHKNPETTGRVLTECCMQLWKTETSSGR